MKRSYVKTFLVKPFIGVLLFTTLIVLLPGFLCMGLGIALRWIGEQWVEFVMEAP